MRVQWLNEREALSDPSLMWACWVLQFVMGEARQLVPPAAVRSRTMMNALLRYITTAGAPFKFKVVSILMQLMKSPHLAGCESPDYGKFIALEGVVMAQVAALRSSGGVFLPWKLQQLVELCAVARLSKRCADTPAPPRAPFDTARDTVMSRMPLFKSLKLRVPVVRPASVKWDPCTDIEAMADVMECADCLAINARLPDRLTVVVASLVAGLPADDPRVTVRWRVVICY